MRLISLIIFAAVGLFVTGCSSPDSRIDKHRAAFDQYPSSVQQKIRTGQVAIGFTPEMVRLSLGEPARVFTRRTTTGDAEVWAYRDNKPSFSFGVGVGSGGGRSGVGGGLGMSTAGDDPEDKIRLEFRDGKVAVIDEVKK